MATIDTRIKTNRGVKVKFTLFDLISVLVLAHSQLPAVGYYMPSVIYLALILVAFFASIFKILEKTSVKPILVFLPLIIIPVLGVLRDLTGGNVVKVATNIYAIIQTYTMGLIATTYIVDGDKHGIKKMLNLILVFTLITSITTIFGCIRYPQASRILATVGSEDAAYNLYTSKNIGSFSFVYGSVLLIPIISVLYKTKNINRIFAIISIILIGIMVLKTEYTIALIVYILLLIIFFIPRITTKKLLVFIALIVGLMIFAGSTVTNIIESVASSDDSEVRASRYEYIEDVLNGESVSSSNDNATRALLYLKSWNAFLGSKGFGTWNSKSAGGHSYILDNLATYGLLGLAIIAFAFIYYYSAILRRVRHKKYYALLLTCFITIIVLAALNPKLNNFSLMFMIPLTCSRVYGFNYDDTKDEVIIEDEDTLGCK